MSVPFVTRCQVRFSFQLSLLELRGISSVMDAVCDISCGAIAGGIGKIAEYPLDTMKSRVQAKDSPYKGYRQCFTSLMKKEGPMGFYRGLAAPVLGAVAEAGVGFWAYGRGQKIYRYARGLDKRTELPIHAYVCSGALAGLAGAHVLTPVELIKVRLQLQSSKGYSGPKYNGILDCGKKVFAKEGIRSLYRGYSATLAREIPGNAAWFGFYNIAIRSMLNKGQTKADLPGWKVALAGAIGGVTYWTAFFPADVVKTRIQSDKRYAKEGLFKGLLHVYQNEGARGLYRGWSITALRAFPSNGVIFFTYEMLAKQWKKLAHRN